MARTLPQDFMCVARAGACVKRRSHTGQFLRKALFAALAPPPSFLPEPLGDAFFGLASRLFVRRMSKSSSSLSS